VPTFDAGSIIATADIDRRPFIASLRELQREGDHFGRNRFTATADLDDRMVNSRLAQIRRELSSLGDATVRVGVGGNSSATLSALQAQQRALSGSSISIRVDTPGADLAIVRLRTLAHQVRTLNGMTIDINTSGAIASLAALRAAAATTGGIAGRTGSQWSVAGSHFSAAAGHVFNLTNAVIMLGPALVPLTAGALAIGGAFTSMAVSAGAAAGVFGLALGGLVKTALENQKSLSKANKELETAKQQLKTATPGTQAYANALDKVRAAQEKVNSVNQSFSPIQRQLVDEIDNVKSSMKDFSNQTERFTGPVAIIGMRAIASSFSHFVPLVKAVSPVMMNIANSVKRWVDTKLDGWVNFLIKNGVPALQRFVGMIRNVMGTLGQGVRDFAPLGQKVITILGRGAMELRKWASGGGFNRFIAYVRENGPQIREFFMALWGAARNVAKALKDMGPFALSTLVIFARIASALPPKVIEALAYAFVAGKLALAGYNIAMGVHAAMLATIRGRTISTWIAMGIFRAAMIAQRAAIVITTAAQWAWNVALTANPIGLVIAAVVAFVAVLAALVAAIVWVAVKTTWFQTAWKYSWHAITHVVLGAWHIIRDDIFKPIVTFFTKTIPDAAGWLWRRIRDRFNDIKASVGGAYNWLRKWVLDPVVNFFTKKIPDAAGWLHRKIRDRIENIRANFRDWYNWVKSRIFEPLGKFFTKIIPDAAAFLYRKIRDRLEDIGDTFWDKYDWIKGKVFIPLGKFFTKTLPEAATFFARKVRDAFGLAAKWIGEKWNSIRKAVASPVNFVINTVYNNGIKKLWDKVADVIFGKGKKHLPHIDPIRFAQGGPVPDNVPGAKRGEDSVRALMMPGEHVLTTDEVDMLGGHKGVYAFRAALHGRQTMPRDAERTGQYALGGAIPEFDIPNPIDIVKKTVKSAVGAVTGLAKGLWDKVKDMARGAVGMVANPILDGIAGTIKSGIGKDTAWKEMMGGVAAAPLKWIKDLIAGDDASNSGMGAGYVPWASWKDGDGTLVTRDGKRLNKRTAAMYDAAEKASGTNFTVSQGSWNAGGVAASAGTHDAGGVLDMGPSSNKNVGFLRSKGFAAWARTPSEGFSPHIHAVAVGDPTMSPAAEAQVKAFFAGKNGLADNAPDTYVPPGGKGSSVGNLSAIVTSVLKELGESPSNLANVLKAINKESGGNPQAINNWDSNAKKGTPSKGLLQVIDSTFQAYAGPYKGRTPFDPYANVYAAINYARQKYGTGWSSRMARPGGYMEGTMSAAAGIHGVAESGAELVISPGMRHFKGGERVLNAKDTRGVLGGGTVRVDMPDKIVVQVNGTQFDAYVDVQSRKTIEAVFDEADRSR
jgi:SLT domain-containing protein